MGTAVSAPPSAVRLPRPAAWRGAPRALVYAYLTGLTVFALGPLVLAWFTAFKTGPQLLDDPYGLPLPPTSENLTSAWDGGHFGAYFRNSLVVSAASVVLMVLVAATCGYALARMRFPGRRLVLTVFLFGLTIPVTAIILPLYVTMRDLNLLDSYWSVVLTHVALGTPIFSFIMQAFFRGLPSELEDAAHVDGCSEFGTFWRVMLPLARPGLLTVALLEFLWTWNNLIIPLVFLTSEEVRTLPIGMLFLQGRFTTDFGLVSAGVIIISVPVVVLFLFFQRTFIEGLTSGSVKG